MDNLSRFYRYSRLICLGAVSGVLILGCATTRQHAEKQQDIAQTWANSKAPAAWVNEPLNSSSLAPVLETTVPAQLNSLIQHALAHNHDLNVAALRVSSAIQSHQIERSSMWPRLDLNASYSDGNGPSRQNLDLNASWELDVWGRLANARGASAADVQVQRALYRAAQQSLQANVAFAWLTAIQDKQLLLLSEQNLKVQQQRLSQLERRLEQGLADALDVRLSRNNVANLTNRYWQNLSSLQESLRRLDVLAGRYPKAEDILPSSIPVLEKQRIEISPVQLLGQRPDILAAEQRLIAERLRVKEAQKRLLPQLTLRATYGNSIAEGSDRSLLDLEDWLERFTASLLQPVFRGGELKALAKLQATRAGIQLETYKQVVLEAWRDVENALAAERFLAERHTALTRALEEARAAEALTIRKYEQGLVNSFELLSAQNRTINAEDAWVRVNIAQYQNRVNLHLVTGEALLTNDSNTPASQRKDS